MINDSFTHNDVIKIFNLPPRTIVHWSQSGLVEAEIEARGAGSKREYNFKNLLEFGLCKELFNIGLGIQSVKKILKKIRNDGDLKAWVLNFKSYYEKKAQEYEKWFALLDENGNKLPHPYHDGILFIFFQEVDIKNELMPLCMDDAIKWLNYINLFNKLYESKKMIIINIGIIRVKLERDISEVLYKIPLKPLKKD